MKKALIIGSTGLVGSHCLELLLHDEQFSHVVALTRSKLSISHPKLTNHLVDFDNSATWESFTITDILFSAMGTTIAKAGSQAQFRKVDFEYPLAIATKCKENGARTHVLVSALGADSHSSIFYNKVKGELENAITSLEFQKNIIVKPSLLLGERNENRLGEKLAQQAFSLFGNLMVGPLARYKGVPASLVAKAMVESAKDSTDNQYQIIENKDIFRFG
jgi:uncharacterized protein YbjT (DUF2867 family)